MYEFSVVAVDGEHMTESEVEEVEISSMGEWNFLKLGQVEFQCALFIVQT
jgi:hypothetical protein